MSVLARGVVRHYKYFLYTYKMHALYFCLIYDTSKNIKTENKKNHSNKRVVPEKLSPAICSNNHCIYSRFTSYMCDIVYNTTKPPALKI